MFTYASRFLSAEEEIITAYHFGVYDLLVLPPSFPYGGMVSDLYTSHYCKSIHLYHRKMLVYPS
jgi:hypothetical protein